MDSDLSRSDLALVREALRQDWPIPPVVKSQILQRLIDYLDREHEEGATASDRQVVIAAKTVCEFMKLSLEQQRLDLMRDRLEGGQTAGTLTELVEEAEKRANEANERERLTELLARCHDDFDLFNSCVLNRPPFCGYQRQWCDDLRDHRAVAIETGNGVGKDFWIGGVVPGWLWTRKNSLVVITGPGQATLGAITFKEIRKAIEGCPFPLGGKMSVGIKTSPHTVTLANGWQCLGFSTTSIERASGHHAGQLLVIVEEASGVDDDVWTALDSLNATKTIAIGNPLRPEGGFVRMCEQAASDKVRGVPKSQSTCYRNLPSTASPHAHLERSPVGLADRTWLEAMARQHGKDSLFYRCHVDAIRPTLSNEQLIPEDHLDRCVSDDAATIAAKTRADGKAGIKRIGCDVGEGCGNARTVVIVRDEAGILELHASRYTGPRDAAEVMVRLALKWGVKEDAVSYDGAGVTGKRMGNALTSKGFGRARAYFGSSSGGRRCTNLRTASALAFARRLDPDHYRGSGSVWVPFHIPPGPTGNRCGRNCSG